MSAFCDGRAGRDEGNLTEPRGTFIRVHQFLEDRLVLFCLDFDNPAVFEGDTKVFDQIASITQWESRGNHSIRAMTVGQGKGLFSRHVGSEYDPIFRQGLRADPFVSAWQSERKICAWGFIVQ